MFQTLLPFHQDVFGSLREGVGEHNKQLYGHDLEVHRQYGLYDRSIFPMTDKYNKLPQEVVDCKTVSEFQSRLMNVVREECKNGNEHWKFKFHARRR